MENQTFRILLADDDEGDRLIFTDAIDEMIIKHIVQTVDDGMQLIEYLTKKDAILPDIIFLDLNMPRKNGLECLKEIRKNEKFGGILIFIYSTSAAEKDIHETFMNGANVYIKKPNNFELLKKLLSKAIDTSSIIKEASLDRKNFFLSI
ncbi:MAG: CheY-like chemotaxis protein [Flavobacteriales bacterium]|jgi:CheY-like chemotaxis protein